MILVVLASLFVAQPAATPPDNGAPAAQAPKNGETGNGTVEDEIEAAAEAVEEAAEQVEEATEAAAEAVDEQAEAVEEAAEEAAEQAEEAAEEAAGEVCRRRQVTDDFGRMRSRKVCTPRG